MNQQPPTAPSHPSFDPFTAPKIERIIAITEPQAEIWMSCLLGGDDANRAYNESISLILKGVLDALALASSIQKLSMRHELMRSTFSKNGRFLCVFEAVEVDFEKYDLSDISQEKRDQEIKQLIKKDALHIFDLEHGPLFKLRLLKTGAEEHHLLFTAHHIICDGWSLGILLQELSALYSASITNKNVLLPEPIPFSIYADVQHLLMESGKYEVIEQFWLNQFADQVPVINLPTDFERPSLRTYKSQRLDFELKPELLATFRQVGIKTGCSLVTTFITVFEVLLYRLTGEAEIVLGLPAAGQAALGMEQVIGHCVNLLPLHSHVDGEIKFIDYITQRKSDILDAYEHQQLTFGRLLKKLPLARDSSRIPLVPVVLNIDMGLANDVDFSGLEFDLISNPREYETFELFLNISGSEDTLSFEWSYNTSLFKEETINQMMQGFTSIMKAVSSNPQICLQDIKLADYSAAYAVLNNTQSEYPSKPLHELFLAQAKNTPMYTAVRCKDQVLSYENLYKKVNQLAHYFIQNQVKPGDTIGVALPRQAEIPLVLLAILQSGANYLPLDPDYPKSRLDFMINDSEVKFIVTTYGYAPIFSDVENQMLLEDVLPTLEKFPESPISLQVSQEETAYIIYTSGSTGKPKGVQVTHKNVVNLLWSVLKEPGLDAEDNVLAITTISFDIAVVEIFLPLLCGATVVMANDEARKDGRLIIELLASENITFLQATPSTWKMLLDAGWKRGSVALKAISGGEHLSPLLAQQILENCDSLFNMYGPTETTIYSTLKNVAKEDQPISIGRPIANTKLFLLDSSENLALPGSSGEIVITGDGVSQGYWKRPELTAEKFITKTIDGKSYRLYRTGDLGKLLPLGEIQCLGRIDQQVKIRGHRIELGEVEQVLLTSGTLKAVAVAAFNDRLIAYIVPQNSDVLSITSLKEKLELALPSYMVPHEFRIVTKLPVTPNGKLDRNALLDMKQRSTTEEMTYTAPRTAAEEIVASIWQDALGIDKIDIFSNFFELGGHSLIAVQIMSRIEKQTGKRLPLASLFEHSTIEKLAYLLDLDTESITWESLVPIKTTGSKTPLFFIHGGHLNVLVFKMLAQYLDKDQPVYALQAKGLLGGKESIESIEEIASYYIKEIKKVNPSGPYALAGYSLGGLLAYEMAKQLIAMKMEVKMLALLDTYAELRFFQKNKLRKNLANMRYFFKKQYANYSNPLNALKKVIDKTHEYAQPYAILFSKLKKTESNQIPIEDELLEKLITLYNSAIDKYHLTALDIKIDVLRAEDQTFYMHDNIFLGWEPLALKGVAVHEVSGQHGNILDPPNDQVTANILQEVLNKS